MTVPVISFFAAGICFSNPLFRLQLGSGRIHECCVYCARVGAVVGFRVLCSDLGIKAGTWLLSDRLQTCDAPAAGGDADECDLPPHLLVRVRFL